MIRGRAGNPTQGGIDRVLYKPLVHIVYMVRIVYMVHIVYIGLLYYSVLYRLLKLYVTIEPIIL